MTVYVFIGPTLDPTIAREELDAVYLPPVSQGDVYRIATRRPVAIGIVDGRFQDVPAVWHKEILWAISRGVAVYGSASMGALRAAELADFGMRGVGWVFEAYRAGLIEDDDEVAVAHDGAGDLVPTSVAMVDIRRTLATAEEHAVIGSATAARLTALMKDLFYPYRTYQALVSVGRRARLPDIDALADWLPEHMVSQKRLDALEMLRTMRRELAAGTERRAAGFTFEHTQFFERLCRSAGDPLLDQPDDDAPAPVTLEDLLDELRLDPDAYAQVRARALARCLAVREAGRAGRGATEPQLRAVADEFRRARQLHGPDETRRWLSANNLSVAQFSTLIRDEHARQTIEADAAGELDIHLRSQLRVDGRYRDLTARAGRKRRFLAGRGLDDPGAALDDTADEELLRWYFGTRGSAVPTDVNAHCQSLGFDDATAFLRAVRREYWFREASQVEIPEFVPAKDSHE